MVTFGLVLRAAGSGVLLVVVLVALAEALVVAELLAEAVLVAEVSARRRRQLHARCLGRAAGATAGDGGSERERGTGDGCRSFS